MPYDPAVTPISKALLRDSFDADKPGWDSLTETETETRRFFIFRS